MCTNLTITGSTPPPGRLPTVVSVDFATDDVTDCTTYECEESKIISPCTKNESDLGDSLVAIIIKANFYDTRVHTVITSFKKDGVQQSFSSTIQGVVGKVNIFWVRIDGMYYKDVTTLTNLAATFTS